MGHAVELSVPLDVSVGVGAVVGGRRPLTAVVGLGRRCAALRCACRPAAPVSRVHRVPGAASAAGLRCRRAARHDDRRSRSFKSCAPGRPARARSAGPSTRSSCRRPGTARCCSTRTATGSPSPSRPTSRPRRPTPSRLPGEDVADDLLAQGYALAGSAWSSNGWAVPEGVAADQGAVRLLRPDRGAAPARVRLGRLPGGPDRPRPSPSRGCPGSAVPRPCAGCWAARTRTSTSPWTSASRVRALLVPNLQLTGYGSHEAAVRQWQRAQKVIVAAATRGGRSAARLALVSALVDAPQQTAQFDGSDPVRAGRCRRGVGPDRAGLRHVRPLRDRAAGRRQPVVQHRERLPDPGERAGAHVHRPAGWSGHDGRAARPARPRTPRGRQRAGPGQGATSGRAHRERCGSRPSRCTPRGTRWSWSRTSGSSRAASQRRPARARPAPALRGPAHDVRGPRALRRRALQLHGRSAGGRDCGSG